MGQPVIFVGLTFCYRAFSVITPNIQARGMVPMKLY